MFLKSGYSLLGDPASSEGWGASVRNCFTFFSTRVFRGRARHIIALVVVVNIVFLGLLPGRLSGAFGGNFGTLLRFRGGDRGHGGGGLRIVSFGSPDLAMGSERRNSGNSKSWTEYLCDELSCSSYLSYVPQADSRAPDPALISNSLYKEAVDNLLAQDFNADEQGLNYTWLRDQYPVPTHADLASQVASFLSSPRPKDPPKETVWVFNFGSWDVWNLAALPRESAETVIDYMVLHLFEQIELLYRASLSDESIAFSDFWSYSSPEVIQKLKTNSLSDTRDEMETFRVLIPETIDISVTPGWPNQRPQPPRPHSLAVHLTNAGYLTDRWNAAIKAHITEWEKLPNPSLDEVNTNHRTEARTGKRSVVERVEEPIYAPFPRRKALLYNAPEFVLEAIIEKQMHDTELVDTTGRGTRPDTDPLVFDEVAQPCVGPDEKGVAQRCGSPEGYLFQTPFALGGRAMRELAKRGAEKARETLYLADPGSASAEAGVGVVEKSESSR